MLNSPSTAANTHHANYDEEKKLTEPLEEQGKTYLLRVGVEISPKIRRGTSLGREAALKDLTRAKTPRLCGVVCTRPELRMRRRPETFHARVISRVRHKRGNIPCEFAHS